MRATPLAISTLLAAVTLAGAAELKTHHTPPQPLATAADKAYAAAMDAMMAGMDVKPTGDADADFVKMMLPHHQGAVDMARVELTHGRDPMLRAMAQAIADSQTKEITEMREWQKAHGK